MPFPTPGDLPGLGIKPAAPGIGRWILYHWTTWEAPNRISSYLITPNHKFNYLGEVCLLLRVVIVVVVFLMGSIFKVLTEYVTILLLF